MWRHWVRYQVLPRNGRSVRPVCLSCSACPACSACLWSGLSSLAAGHYQCHLWDFEHSNSKAILTVILSNSWWHNSWLGSLAILLKKGREAYQGHRMIKSLNILLPPLREISGIGDIRKIHAGDVGHGDPRGNGRRVHPLSARHGGSLCRGPIIAKFCQHNQHSSFLSQPYCDVKLLGCTWMYFSRFRSNCL